MKWFFIDMFKKTKFIKTIKTNLYKIKDFTLKKNNQSL